MCFIAKCIPTKMTASLLTIPTDLIYRIFDHLHPTTLLLSLNNVCTQLNTILDNYPPFQVICLSLLAMIVFTRQFRY